jgi:UrcA family protein
MSGQKLCLGIAAAAFAIGVAGTATAQPPPYYSASYGPEQPYTFPEVTITAPRTLGRGPNGAPIEIIRESRVVSARDLDLGTGYGAYVLRARIERAARDACDDIDARYLVADPGSPDCFHAAVRSAMYEVEATLRFAPPTWPIVAVSY